MGPELPRGSGFAHGTLSFTSYSQKKAQTKRYLLQVNFPRKSLMKIISLSNESFGYFISPYKCLLIIYQLMINLAYLIYYTIRSQGTRYSLLYSLKA